MQAPQASDPAQIVAWTDLDLGRLLEMEAVSLDRYVSRHNENNGAGRIFGGQILAQAMRAAQLTVPPGRALHALQLMFSGSGRPGEAISYQVERISDGASTSVRSVRAHQAGKTLCMAMASSRAPGGEFEHEDRLECAVQPPAQCLSMPELLRRCNGQLDQHAWSYIARKASVELRLVDAERFLASMHAKRASPVHFWIRCPNRLGDAPELHDAALAYLTDYMLALVPVLQLMPLPEMRDVHMASVNHALWFYRPVRADEWLLVEVDCAAAAGGRGLPFAKVYNQERKVAAVVTQECLYQRATS